MLLLQHLSSIMRCTAPLKTCLDLVQEDRAHVSNLAALQARAENGSLPGVDLGNLHSCYCCSRQQAANNAGLSGCTAGGVAGDRTGGCPLPTLLPPTTTRIYCP